MKYTAVHSVRIDNVLVSIDADQCLRIAKVELLKKQRIRDYIGTEQLSFGNRLADNKMICALADGKIKFHDLFNL
jgi:hypothetical protein